MLNLKKHIFIILLVVSGNIGYCQWTELKNLEEYSIHELNFIRNDLGYILAGMETGVSAKIMKTSDGGLNWVDISLPDTKGEIQDIYFFGDGKGVLILRDVESFEVPTKLFQTFDDGLTWTEISPGSTPKGIGVGQCQFFDEKHGYFTTDKYLFSTNDGGVNWKVDEFEEYILCFEFNDAMNGLIGTWDGTFGYKGSILLTTDGGLSWKKKKIQENYTSIGKVRQINNRIAIAAPIHGWAAIQANSAYLTIDSGLSWNPIEVPKPFENSTLRQIDFRDNLNGVMCVGNSVSTLIYKTTDGGQNWTVEDTIPSTYDLYLQLTDHTGYIGGFPGSLYKVQKIVSHLEEPDMENLVLYPCPAKAGHQVRWESEEFFTRFSIFDQMGKAVFMQDIFNDYIELPYLDPGVYVVTLSNKNTFKSSVLILD